MIVGLFFVPCADGEWITFHKDNNRSGFSLEDVGPANPSILWSFETGDYVYSSPIYSNGKVYVGSGDGILYCFDSGTGEVIWTFETEGAIQGTATINGDQIFVPSYDDNLYCLDLDTGNEIWSFPSGGDIFSSPAVDSGLVVFGASNNQLFCLNQEDGSQEWSFPTTASVWASPNLEDGRVYFGAGTSFYCLDLNSGIPIWAIPLGEFIIATAAVQYQEVYVATNGNTLSGTLYLLDGRTGQPLWTYQDPEGAGFFSSPAISERMVVIGSDSGYVHCVERDSGAHQWSYDAGDLVQSSPAITNGFVYVGCDDGSIHCIDFETGLGVWTLKLGDEIVRSSPCVGDEKLWVGSWDYSVYCLGGESVEPGVSLNILEPSKENMSADESYSIRCEIEVSDINDTISLYYAPQMNDSLVELIISGPVSQITGMYTWDTSNVPEGSYWIKAELESGNISVKDWSEGTVLVRHPDESEEDDTISVGVGFLEILVILGLAMVFHKRS